MTEALELTITGIGIHHSHQVTAEAMAAIEDADCLLGDPVSVLWLESLGMICTPLPFRPGRERRRDGYQEIVASIMKSLSENRRVCVVFYGNPVVFNDVTYATLTEAHTRMVRTRVIAGISAEANILTDVAQFFASRGLPNPFRLGWMNVETTDFLIRPKRFDPSVALLLWQPALLGNLSSDRRPEMDTKLLPLQETLLKAWPEDHDIVIYAAQFDGIEADLRTVPLADLSKTRLAITTTLVIPPSGPAPLDVAMMARLNLPMDSQ